MRKIFWIVVCLLISSGVIIAREQYSIEDLRKLDTQARQGDVESMEKIADYFYDSGLQSDKGLKSLGLLWWLYASDNGSAVGAYTMGKYYENAEIKRIAKALAYYELAKSRGYMAANERINAIHNQIQPISSELKAKLPKEFEDDLLSHEYTLAKLGYIEAIEQFCHHELFHIYGIYGGPEVIRSLPDDIAMKVIPLLKAAAPVKPRCEFMLACVLSNMRCYDKVFDTEDESSFVDLKEAQRLIKSYQKHPIKPEGKGYNLPFALDENTINVMQENILGYNANIILKKPKATSDLKIEEIPTIDEIISVPISDVIYYPMGLKYMPKNGDGVLEQSQFHKVVNLMNANYKKKFSIDDNSNDTKYIFTNGNHIVFNATKWRGTFYSDKDVSFSGWMYAATTNNLSQAMKIAKDIT